MGRKICNRWFSRIVGVIASLSAFCISGKDDYVQPVVEEVVEDILENDIDGLAGSMANTATVSTNSCHTVKDKLLMFASTLDGRISVLDVHNDGQLLWSVQADARPLLSSSIGKLQLNKDGVRTRLIPSLDGGLYQYDGDSIEAVPITAEKLLGSSFHLDDNTMMIGGKDTKSYGVDALSGQVRYVCGVEGCKFFGEGEVTDDEDIIVIKRSTQTVRAVEARTGAERWNFSVGHHELEFIDASLPITDDDKDGITITPCPVKGDDDTEEVNTYADLDQALKIIVPEGIVVALNPEDDAHILWQHKFSSPVTGAWILKKGVMKNLSLFDNRHIPALSSFQPENMDGLPREPLLYVGMHQNQLYVQPSAGFRDDVVPSPGNNFLPPVAWRPYLSSAASRTPIFKGNQRNDVPLLGDKSVESKDKSLIVWHENYPFDNGYYLYPDVQRLLPVQNLTPESSTIMFIPTSLHYWWKEVIAISVLTSIVLHIVLSRIVRKEIPESSNNLNINSNNSKVSRSDSENSVTHTEFISRFSTEFEFVHCLGKGGFGVVFEAKNRMDECHYAVKRICLSNSIGAKDRVMREVRALAKLDNPGIVRYFNAWMENPPLDWKDSLNTCLEDSECILPTPCNSGTDLSSLKFGGQFGNFALSSNDWGLKCGTSQVFNVHETEDISTDESGSYSIGTCDQQKNYKDNEVSFQIEFADPDLKSEQSSTTNEHTFNDSDSVTIPFQNYNAVPSKDNSLCIVFEDSGCKDKSSNESDINRYSDNVVFDNDYTNDKDSNDNESNKLEKVVVEKQNTEPSGNLYLYIQMQLCRRETLKDWLCANTLNRDRRTILDIFDQIVEAVDYVHGCGLMHRDLKPSNIFFSMDGAIKIGDFGLVTGLEKQSDQFVQEITGDYMKHTAEVGTQLYMSPEQVTRGTYDHKVDIFSMGMILFELFYPFSTQMERITVLVDIKRQIFPPRFVKEMPNENKFAGWLLALNPAERPSTTQILDSELLKDFAARRSSNRFRSRTISGGSSSSTTAI